MSNFQQVPTAINFADLPKVVKNNPRYAKMLAGLAQIDSQVKMFVEDIVCNQTDGSVYYIKTELHGPCYNLLLYNVETRVTVGVSWLLDTFLKKCENKTLEYDVNLKVSDILKKFYSKTEAGKTYWIE